MQWPKLALAAIVAVTLTGCDRSPASGEDEGGAAVGDQAPGAADRDTVTAMQPTTTPPAPPATESEPQRPAPVRTTPAADEPWEPVYTGTVNPGMSREEVVGVWGAPVAERVADGRTYLFYRNGCEVTCGTFDVVFLEGGQVVDAIVRGRGHTYSGTSSSPAGTEAVPNVPAGQAQT